MEGEKANSDSARADRNAERAYPLQQEEKSKDPVVDFNLKANVRLLILRSAGLLVLAAAGELLAFRQAMEEQRKQEQAMEEQRIPVVQEEKSNDQDPEPAAELRGSLLSLLSHVTTPFHSNSLLLQALEEREDGSSIITFEFSDGRTAQVLRRDCGDILQVSQCKGVIVNEPHIVAAVGGIPDELKIAGGISFSFAAPTFMVPKMLLRDPGQRLEVLTKVYKDGTRKGGYKYAIVQAYVNALIRSRSTCKQLEEEGRNIDQQPMVEVNLIPTTCAV